MLRLFYAAGPGDVAGSYRYWKQGLDDPRIPGITDSGQFYSLTKELNAEALVISQSAKTDLLSDPPFTIRHMAKKTGKGIFYHLHHLSYGLKIVKEAVRFKPDLVVIEEGTSYGLSFAF